MIRDRNIGETIQSHVSGAMSRWVPWLSDTTIPSAVTGEKQ